MGRIIKNIFISFGNLFRKPRTVVYPREKIIIPENSRGLLHLKLDLDSLELICNGCGMCERICPQNCIKIVKMTDKTGKDILEDFIIDLSRCSFCGNCVEICDYDAIEMTYRHQLSEYRRKDLILNKSDLVKQGDYTIRDFWSK